MTKSIKHPRDSVVSIPLTRLISEAGNRTIQIPEFQRKLELKDEWVKSFLASVSMGYSVGAIMLLEAGNPKFQFNSYPIFGAIPSSAEPKWLLIDGRRRVSTLYQVLATTHPVQVINNQQRHEKLHYYMDMRIAIDSSADRDQAIISIDKSTFGNKRAEFEWQNCLFPFNLILADSQELKRWQDAFIQRGSKNRIDNPAGLTNRFGVEVIETFRQYIIPAIVLDKETTRWSIRVHGGKDGRILSDRFDTPK